MVACLTCYSPALVLLQLPPPFRHRFGNIYNQPVYEDTETNTFTSLYRGFATAKLPIEA